MQVDSPDGRSAGHDDEQETRQAWELTRAGQRIAELKEIEDNIAVLLHFAGCALASLHTEPMSSFTLRELAVEGEADTEAEAQQGEAASRAGDHKSVSSGEKDKAVEFGKYAEAYYTTLNDIQVGLRTSIRHMRLNRTSPAPLVDPTVGSLAGSAGPQPASVGVGGVALADRLKPLSLEVPVWHGRNQRSSRQGDDEAAATQLSVAARELEKEAWTDLADALDRP
ncbi:uncharacterized protein JCM15063_002358 [Sporobolomyces koalae]|uniref:uncharacterized protein n=1 Tax=Sporobolomyces koalae TaxID=500713 RepID=UPI00317EF866